MWAREKHVWFTRKAYPIPLSLEACLDVLTKVHTYLVVIIIQKIEGSMLRTLGCQGLSNTLRIVKNCFSCHRFQFNRLPSDNHGLHRLEDPTDTQICNQAHRLTETTLMLSCFLGPDTLEFDCCIPDEGTLAQLHCAAVHGTTSFLMNFLLTVRILSLKNTMARTSSIYLLFLVRPSIQQLQLVIFRSSFPVPMVRSGLEPTLKWTLQYNNMLGLSGRYGVANCKADRWRANL